MARQLPKDCSFSGQNETTPGRNVLECLYASHLEHFNPGSCYSDNGQLLQWEGALLICSSSCPNSQRSRSGVLQNGNFYVPIFPSFGVMPQWPLATKQLYLLGWASSKWPEITMRPLQIGRLTRSSVRFSLDVG